MCIGFSFLPAGKSRPEERLVDTNLNLVQIESGVTSYVNWTKFPDGTLIQSGVAIGRWK
jgi:hypothetical protein